MIELWVDSPLPEHDLDRKGLRTVLGKHLRLTEVEIAITNNYDGLRYAFPDNVLRLDVVDGALLYLSTIGVQWHTSTR